MDSTVMKWFLMQNSKPNQMRYLLDAGSTPITTLVKILYTLYRKDVKFDGVIYCCC